MSDLLKKDNNRRQEDPVLPCEVVRMVLHPAEKDLGGFSVRRLLPATELKSVGPVIFFDHFGPARFAPGQGMDVRPHPHIGLATITYLFAGEILHRDSLGNVQSIRPAEVNWMTAGRGISHSERTPPALRETGHSLHGLQLWVALPENLEQVEADFVHYAAEQIPLIHHQGVSLRLIVGEAWGVRSPVRAASPTLYADVQISQGATLELPDEVGERAVYVVAGELQVQGVTIPQHCLTLLNATQGLEVTATTEGRLIVIGGKPLGKRTVWWNLVSSRKELIEQAKDDWRSGRFPQVPDETEKIPVPGT
ncbi:pirin family protein [Pelovirga terrestris]|uniref:Pirin family protein n=1 Tax=Pelovirga terrestris TaxID=2771352 RepID=A0A8J6QQK6_9BACT|nr:pirin family protein [Pelovirga terrestris]MBD1401306.1 pirin family protein [Pelovirga terrestris]